jgi:hypothetical protein
LRKVFARFLHQRQRIRLEQLQRLNVNVAVSNHKEAVSDQP